MATYEFERALIEMDRIHKRVSPNDSFERKLYNDIIEAGKLTVSIHDAMGHKTADVNQDLCELVDCYFAACKNPGFKYRDVLDPVF